MKTDDIICLSVLDEKSRTRSSTVVQEVMFPKILRQTNTQATLYALDIQLGKRRSGLFKNDHYLSPCQRLYRTPWCFSYCATEYEKPSFTIRVQDILKRCSRGHHFCSDNATRIKPTILRMANISSALGWLT